MVGVGVGDDDRVDPVGGRRAQFGKQSGQRAVPEVEDDPGARVLQDVAAAGTAGFRPGAAAAKDDEPTVHRSTLPCAAVRSQSLSTVDP